MCASDFIHLGDGLIVPAEPLLALLRLEAAGHTIAIDGDDLTVQRARSGPPIAEDDLDAVRRWKGHCWLIVWKLTGPPAGDQATTTGPGTPVTRLR